MFWVKVLIKINNKCEFQIYQYESPWPSAQAELICLGAYKTPHDKVRCVALTCTTIANILSIGPKMSGKSADDIMPILIYVLIQVSFYNII